MGNAGAWKEPSHCAARVNRKVHHHSTGAEVRRHPPQASTRLAVPVQLIGIGSLRTLDMLKMGLEAGKKLIGMAEIV